MFQKKVKAYWWNKIPNFGDELAPLLLARFSYLKSDWCPVSEASIVSVGSVLEHVPPGWSGYILGSGKLRENSKLKFDPSKAKILALRGPLTAKGIPGDYDLGDPGLLAGELIEPEEKQWDLGILPHWQDGELAERFLNIIPKKFSCKVISPWDDPIHVIKDISRSHRLVTSSLHGMIVADSLRIPRRVESYNKTMANGGMFKFLDYSASIHTPFETGKMIEPSSCRVEDTKASIYNAYRQFGRSK